MVLHPLRLARTGLRTLSSNVRNQMFNFSTTAIKLNQETQKEDEDEDVTFECFDGGKGLITLNRPKQLNTLNTCMIRKLREMLPSWAEDKYLIGIKGSGEKAFCAGGDVVAVTKDKCGEVGKAFFSEEYKLDAFISSLKVPLVAFLGGIVMGGGVGISIFGKYRIATETSMFAMPETQIGFFPDVGVSHILARMPNHLGDFLALTGFRLKGYDLVHAGIATHFCSQSKISELENALFRDFCKSMCSTPEETINEFHCESVKSLSKDENPPFSLEPHLTAIDNWFSSCTLDEALAKMCNDKNPFAKDTFECLKNMSPLSLKVTFKQIKNAAEMEIYDCFNSDYRVALRMMEKGDFTEGVRALLIDKDKKPKWKHESVSKVTDREVDEFFCGLPNDQELNLPDSMHC